jgi:PKD repeat protein
MTKEVGMRRIWKIGLVVVFGLGLAGCAWLFAPPQAVLTANVDSGVAPLSVTFSAASSTGDIVSYTLTFGDGSTPETGTDITEAEAVPHTYNAPGTYTATLTVQDARGRTSSASVVITVSAAPTAAVSLGAFPALGSAPLDVDFSAAITAAPGRRIKHLALDYGDGGPKYEAVVDFASYSGPIASHTYADPGDYTATLTVTDDASQTFSATATITVTSPPPEIMAFTINSLSDEPVEVVEDTAVTFAFEAQAGGTGRKIVKYTLLCPGSNVPSLTEEGLTESTLTRNNLMRTYLQTGSYTATLKVWDDEDNKIRQP